MVAGMADATVVIETAVKGGSMITADLAFGYNRELFAVPGRLNDARSAGCLQLIQQQKAHLYTGPEQFLHTMGWELPQRSLAVADLAAANLSSKEQALVQLLQEKDGCSTEELQWLLSVDPGSLANMLLNLEMQHIIRTLPGKRICLL